MCWLDDEHWQSRWNADREHVSQAPRKEPIVDLELMQGPSTRCNKLENDANGGRLTMGEKASKKSMPKCWVNPRTIRRAVYLSKQPLEWSLCRNIHLPYMTMALGCRGMSIHIRSNLNTSNLACVDARQLGSQRVAGVERGDGETTVMVRA